MKTEPGVLQRAVDFARRIRRSEQFKRSVALPTRVALHARQRLNDGVFAIEIRANSGFFSVMQMVLFILMYCEERKLAPLITARGGIYGDTEGKVDWFGQYFETLQVSPPSVSTRKAHRSTVRDLVQLGLRNRYESRLQLDAASQLFLSHYRPARDIRDEVDAICRSLEIGKWTLGVHFRGTDKKHEATTIGWREFCQQVEVTLEEHPHLTNLFVSSDEQAFIDFFVAWPFHKPVKLAPAKFLAEHGKPIHFSGHPGLAIGREALISSLLLANCGFLVKTPSYLSAWSKIFQPELPVKLVCAPLAGANWFPDSRIWDEQHQDASVV